MDTSLILQNIGRHIQLTPDEEAHFLSLLKPRRVKRKEMILQEGEVCHYSTFVLEGCLRSYTLDKNGVEHVLSFAPEDWWIADLYSFFSQRPGNLYIEANKASEVLQLSKTDQDQLYLDVPKFERFFRIIMENSLVSHQQRLLDNLSLPAPERYRNFCRRYPTLVATMPRKQIASYIGVTPEFFSKMMKEVLRGERGGA
ncbi:MAG: Crp/Fnr family transcriptional regulator [Phaeodactylibacter sp.]|nr:Crp/Fnr family transcriptional regulator [Phaeodactylibacter sp.]MCB9273638.1 Crp/Fnr family transcriptional regulator [Lewinellaceae bacterium]